MASPEHVGGNCHVSATSHIHSSISLYAGSIYLFYELRGKISLCGCTPEALTLLL